MIRVHPCFDIMHPSVYGLIGALDPKVQSSSVMMLLLHFFNKGSYELRIFCAQSHGGRAHEPWLPFKVYDILGGD